MITCGITHLHISHNLPWLEGSQYTGNPTYPYTWLRILKVKLPVYWPPIKVHYWICAYCIYEEEDYAIRQICECKMWQKIWYSKNGNSMFSILTKILPIITRVMWKQNVGKMVQIKGNKIEKNQNFQKRMCKKTKTKNKQTKVQRSSHIERIQMLAECNTWLWACKSWKEVPSIQDQWTGVVRSMNNIIFLISRKCKTLSYF